MNPKVKIARPLAEHRLFLEFVNGEQRVFDVGPYLSRGVFRGLTNPRAFEAARSSRGRSSGPGRST